MGSINLGSNGTITNLAVGGLPDGSVDADSLASNSVANVKVADDAIGVAELSATGTASSSTYLRGDNSWATVSTQDTLSFRNIIINGAMNVAQRATSSTSTAYQTCDRIRVDTANVDEDATQAQVSLSSSDTGPWAKGFRKALQITNGNQTSGAGSNDLVNAAMYLEGQDVHLIWEPNNTNSEITLSWWMKSSVAQTFYGYIRTLNGTSKSIAFTTGSLSANTWTKITKTIPGHADLTIPNDNTAGIGIFWDFFRGTDRTDSGVSTTAWKTYESSARTPDCTSTWYTTNDSTITMTGIQLEAGDTATEFEHRTYGEELRRCLRYYWDATTSMDVHPLAYGTGGAGLGQWTFVETMRTTPSITATNNSNSANIYGRTNQFGRIYKEGTNWANVNGLKHDAEL